MSAPAPISAMPAFLAASSVSNIDSSLRSMVWLPANDMTSNPWSSSSPAPSSGLNGGPSHSRAAEAGVQLAVSPVGQRLLQLPERDVPAAQQVADCLEVPPAVAVAAGRRPLRPGVSGTQGSLSFQEWPRDGGEGLASHTFRLGEIQGIDSACIEE